MRRWMGLFTFALLAFVAVRIQPVAQKREMTSRTYGYQVVKSYPHDRAAFTQGLVYRDGYLYESTGLEGKSTLRKVDLNTGRVLQQYDLLPNYFGEGLTDWGPHLIQLTYQTQTGFVYDRETLTLKSSFAYSGEGWGLTQDGTRLIMSDGTSTLRFLDPVTFSEKGRVTVRDGGQPVVDLNELEYVRGEIYANVWRTDRIARISPATGEVVGWIDLRNLVKPGEIPRSSPSFEAAVLNGIAYDAAKDRLFVTGKLWPKLFEIRVVSR